VVKNDNNAHQYRQKGQIPDVLIADNDCRSARLILEILARKNVHADLAEDYKRAVSFLDNNRYNLVFTAETISTQQDGFELLAKVKESSPELPVIMMAQPQGAGQENQQQLVAAAVKAVRNGCCDFLTKPLDGEKIQNILQTYLPNHDVCTAACAQHNCRTVYNIVGRSPKLLQTLNLAKKIAPTSVPVLITGESGTGKELLGLLIHHHSKRVNGPYVKVNCAALSDSLLESELFGHERGAFTGAYTQRKGRFETAHSGTLLLDEITETPVKFQAKLLRVIEQQDFERVGGNENISINVRITATTNKDILYEIQRGRFRRDLYYRLCGVRLVMSPLRERPEDLVDMVWHFVNIHAHQTHRKIAALDPAMMNIFADYSWPGNVRQLRNVVVTSLLLGVGQTLSLADVSWLFDELQPLPEIAHNQPCNCDTKIEQVLPFAAAPLDQIERRAILDTLRHTAGNQTRAAKALGISDRTLRDKLRRYRRQGILQTT